VVTWGAEQSGDVRYLVTKWIERNGPPVRPPARHGFGMTLIERGMSHDLSGRADIAFLPEGVQVTLRVPFDGNVQPDGA
jgi:two-component sensor histidine kinase